MKLKKIAEGEEDSALFYKEIKSFVEEIVSDIFSREGKVEARSSLGMCPKCKKGKIIEGKKSFGCSEWKGGCDFVIWKEIAGKKLSQAQVSTLIKAGKTPAIKGFVSKAGKPFEARLKLSPQLKVEFDFDKK